MNIQEMATCYCEKLPVKVMLLNNMHLGMVVQWEDRFHAANRAHTYLGPIDDPEAIGQGNGITPDQRYPDFVDHRQRFPLEGPAGVAKGRVGRGIPRDDRLAGPISAGRAGALPGARAADDPGRHDGAGFDQGVIGGTDIPVCQLSSE